MYLVYVNVKNHKIQCNIYIYYERLNQVSGILSNLVRTDGQFFFVFKTRLKSNSIFIQIETVLNV